MWIFNSWFRNKNWEFLINLEKVKCLLKFSDLDANRCILYFMSISFCFACCIYALLIYIILTWRVREKMRRRNLIKKQIYTYIYFLCCKVYSPVAFNLIICLENFCWQVNIRNLLYFILHVISVVNYYIQFARIFFIKSALLSTNL